MYKKVDYCFINKGFTNCKKQSKEPKPILTFNIIIFNYIKLINIDEVIIYEVIIL